MMWMSEDKIRIINKYGLDTVMQLDATQLDKDGCGKVTIESICKIDHWDDRDDDRHMILDRRSLPANETFSRLIRMGQKFKVHQYHNKVALAAKAGIPNPRYYKEMHEKILTVDYSQESSSPDSQFVAEINFTILDWQIIERLIQNKSDFRLVDIDKKRQ